MAIRAPEKHFSVRRRRAPSDWESPDVLTAYARIHADMTRKRTNANAPDDQPLSSEQGSNPAPKRKRKKTPQPEKVASKSTEPPAKVQPDAGEPTDTAKAGFPIAGVGASAGGLEAYRRLLQALPVDTGVALVLVQHLDPTHASLLAEILSRSTRMSVREVTGQ